MQRAPLASNAPNHLGLCALRYFVRCPGCSAGVVLDEPVSHIDIGAWS